MAEVYAYTGGMELWYQNYLDAATGKMLVAVPRDDPYSMFSVNPGLPIPPNDGRWQEVVPAPAPAPAKSAPVSAPAPAAPAPEGGDE